MDKFCEHSWQFTTHDPDKNALDAYMKAWGVGVVYRTMMNKSSPILRFKESKKEPGKYYLITRSARKGLMVKRFVVGPFEIGGEAILDTRADGQKFLNTFTLSEDGKTLTHVQKHEGGVIKEAVTTRVLSDDGKTMEVKAECDGKTVVRGYAGEPHVESAEDEEL